jgi:hypothetical protein
MSTERRAAWAAVLWPILAVTCAALLWGLSLDGINLSHMSDLGLVSVLPPSAWAALVLLVVSSCVAIHWRAPEPVLFLCIVVLVVMIYGTPAILERTLRYSWSWKHIGITDYIQRHGEVAITPAVPFIMVPHLNWPGFFALNAFIAETAGLESSLGYAVWASIFFDLLWVCAVLAILRTLTRDRRLIWLGVLFFCITNWVGQDYFSPQALAYFLYLSILGVCLKWFGAKAPELTIKRWPRLNWVKGALHSLVGRLVQDPVSDATLLAFQRFGLMAFVILTLVAIVSTHQLTPFMIIGSLVSLVGLRRCNARSLPILVVVLTGTWLAYVAEAFWSTQWNNIIAFVGPLGENVNACLIQVAPLSLGQRIVVLAGRGLSAFLWGIAFLGGVRLLCYRRFDLLAMFLAAFPLFMLALYAYGGEMLFRSYLFSLPFMAFFAAASIYPTPASSTSWKTVIVTALVSCIFLVGFSFAYYGKEQQSYFTQNEVDAAQYLYKVAPKGSLLIEGSWNHPSRFRNYEAYTYISIMDELQMGETDVVVQPADVLSEWIRDGKYQWVRNEEYSAVYVVITRSQKAFVDLLGFMPRGSLDYIEQSLVQDERFEMIYGNEDAKIFSFSDTSEE